MQNKISKVGLAALVAFMASLGALQAAGVGTTGAQFLRVGVGARAVGLGGAFSALADDVTAIHWNPAGLGQLEKNEASLSYNAYFADTSAQFLGYAHHAENCTFAGAVNMLSVTDIEKRSATAGDANTPDGGTFKTQDLAGTLAWGHKFDMGGKPFFAGVGLKYISSDLHTAKGTAFAVDLGAIMSIGEPESIGGGTLQGSLAVLNLGTKIKFSNESDPLPLNVKPGVAWKAKLAERPFSAVVDADLLLNDQVNLINVGAEYWLIEQIGLRGGYQIGRGAGAGNFAGGLGFKHTGLGVDYAFAPFGDLGDTHRVSLSYRF